LEGFYGLFYGINLSVAVAVGFIALFGLAIETAMLITIYLNEAMIKMKNMEIAVKQLQRRYYEDYIIYAKRLRPN
jgi:Cu(I)/Ag(I) efflux system membrane protein CusA/SilA